MAKYQIKGRFKGQKRWSKNNSLWMTNLTKGNADKWAKDFRQDRVGLLVKKSIKVSKQR